MQAEKELNAAEEQLQAAEKAAEMATAENVAEECAAAPLEAPGAAASGGKRQRLRTYPPRRVHYVRGRTPPPPPTLTSSVQVTATASTASLLQRRRQSRGEAAAQSSSPRVSFAEELVQPPQQAQAVQQAQQAQRAAGAAGAAAAAAAAVGPQPAAATVRPPAPRAVFTSAEARGEPAFRHCGRRRGGGRCVARDDVRTRRTDRRRPASCDAHPALRRLGGGACEAENGVGGGGGGGGRARLVARAD